MLGLEEEEEAPFLRPPAAALLSSVAVLPTVTLPQLVVDVASRRSSGGDAIALLFVAEPAAYTAMTLAQIAAMRIANHPLPGTFRSVADQNDASTTMKMEKKTIGIKTFVFHTVKNTKLMKHVVNSMSANTAIPYASPITFESRKASTTLRQSTARAQLIAGM